MACEEKDIADVGFYQSRKHYKGNDWNLICMAS